MDSGGICFPSAASLLPHVSPFPKRSFNLSLYTQALSPAIPTLPTSKECTFWSTPSQGGTDDRKWNGTQDLQFPVARFLSDRLHYLH